MTDRRTAWYLRCAAGDLADRAVIVGDRGRVELAAEQLEDVAWVNEDRGLTTITGTHRGRPVTVAAFGMGAPIAAIVVDELIQLGVGLIVRLGTAMTVPPTELGDLVVAEAAVREESTSDTYVPAGYPASADATVTAALVARASDTGHPVRTGLIASYDGFYTQMVPTDGHEPVRPPPGVLGLDMETSVVLAVGRAKGIRTGSLCLATVDGATADVLASESRTAGERTLLATGLDVVAECELISDSPTTKDVRS